MENKRIAAALSAFAKHSDKVMGPFEEQQRLRNERARRKAGIYVKKRSLEDRNFRLMRLLRNRLHLALRARAGDKCHKTQRMLGCSVTEFMEYIASLFKPGMSWDNHGEWELDHIKPCRAFDLQNPDEQNKCFHHTNFAPLWRSENRSKSDKWNGLSARIKGQ